MTGVQRGRHYVRQLEIHDRSWMSSFVVLPLTLGCVCVIVLYCITVRQTFIM